MSSNIPKHMTMRSQALCMAACLAILAIAAYFDTAPELTLDVIYLIPIGVAGWFAGLWPGIFVSLAAGVGWGLAYHYSGYRAAHPEQFWWNAGMLEGFFLTVGILFAKLKDARRRLLENKLELEASNEKLREAIERLHVLDRQKDQFLAVCSHDIRSPLCGILAGCELLIQEIRGPLQQAQREIVERNVKSSREIIALTSDLLDLARIEAGQEMLKSERLELISVLKESVELFKQMLNSRVHFEIQQDCALIEIEGDRLKLRRIFNNLISNAAKYSTEHGTVKITVRTDTQQAIVSIADSGPGIAPENLSKVFDRFSSLATLKQTRDEGTGLGMSITQGLVELHAGKIEVASELGRGTTFTVRLPRIKSTKTITTTVNRAELAESLMLSNPAL